MGNELYTKKQENLNKILAHQEGEWVPTLSMFTGGAVAWAGTTFKEVWHDPERYVKAMCKVYEDIWVDTFQLASLINPVDIVDYFPEIQNKLGPDGTTLEHLQRSPMEVGEYDQLIANPDKFVADVLIPRMFPKFFEDRTWAKEGVKRLAQSRAHLFGTLTESTHKEIEERFGIIPIMRSGIAFANPLDIIFDSFRGFRGTLTDIRRQPEKVKAALDVIWENQMVPRMKPLDDPYPYIFQPPHIPAYISPKQFEALYWPYQRKIIEWVAGQNSKLLFVLEGKWSNILHFFREVPKDSCVLLVDDDDIFEVNRVLGDWQIIVGGLKAADTRFDSKEVLFDKTKRVIDACAPGGGFLFGMDKVCLAPGDVNQNVADVYNFVHEYGKY